MNCIIAQSGGPTSVINSSLSGVITCAIDQGFERIFGSLNGIEGILNDNIVEIDKDKFISSNAQIRLMNRPSSILGSCRYKLPDSIEDKIYDKIFRKLKELEITSFIYIGGNDSMDTVMKLNRYMKAHDITGINVCGVPKTIDNDLCVMDHSPGFGSASKFVNNTIINIRNDIDIYDLNSVTIVEIMGRNAGWICASSLLANKNSKVVDLIYLSEIEKSKEDILKEVKEAFKYNKNLLIAVSEGFQDKDKFFINNNDQVYDKRFNHPIIAGVAQNMSDYIHRKLNVKTRAIELSIIQRTSNIISKTDSNEAFNLGYQALRLSIDNTDIIPILKRKDSTKYEVEYSYVNSSDVANKEKLIPKSWLQDMNTLQENMIEYALPIIQGEFDDIYENGMLSFINLCDFIKVNN